LTWQAVRPHESARKWERMQLSEAVVVVDGLGLMGGSLALALRGKCRAVIGVARRAEARENALQRGAVDLATSHLPEAARQADIVVLATPVRQIIEAIPQVAPAMRPGALLMDLGSTKREIVAAMNRMPEGAMAVGGHPMCGKEAGGLDSADADLFRGAKFVLTPTDRTTEDAMALATELVEAVGARPLILDAEWHDRAVAIVSHLPYLLSAALVHTEAEASAEDAVVGDLAASGFRDTTRLAASQVDMMLDILLTNRDEVERALALLECKLAGARRLLNDPAALNEWMTKAQTRRREMFC
jgi:prephenate dehydrogenase